MPFKLTIEKAISVAGSQEKLAELIGEKQTHISAFKNGKRVCGLKKRIQIAEIAGENPVETIFDYFAESLDEGAEFESEAKRIVFDVLASLEPETKKPLQALGSQGVSWRKRRDSNPR